MPKGPSAPVKTLQKKGVPVEETSIDSDLPDLDTSALDELDAMLSEDAPKKKTEPKKQTNKPKKVKEEDVELPDFDEPDVSEIEGFDSSGVSGVMARIDSLVEISSDHYNSTNNRLESIQTTLKAVFDYIQTRLDDLEARLEGAESADAPEVEEEEGIDPTDAKAVAAAIGQKDVALLDKLLGKAREFSKPIATSSFNAWLAKAGLADKVVKNLNELFGLDAKGNVTKENFGG